MTKVFYWREGRVFWTIVSSNADVREVAKQIEAAYGNIVILREGRIVYSTIKG